MQNSMCNAACDRSIFSCAADRAPPTVRRERFKPGLSDSPGLEPAAAERTRCASVTSDPTESCESLSPAFCACVSPPHPRCQATTGKKHISSYLRSARLRVEKGLLLAYCAVLPYTAYTILPGSPSRPRWPAQYSQATPDVCHVQGFDRIMPADDAERK